VESYKNQFIFIWTLEHMTQLEITLFNQHLLLHNYLET